MPSVLDVLGQDGEAVGAHLGKPAADIAWGTKIEHDGVMDLVSVDDAIAAFERYRTDHPHVGA